MEIRRPAVGAWGDLKNGVGYIYLNDENLYNLTAGQLGWTYLEKRVGEQITARPSFYATQLWTLIYYAPNYLLSTGNWNSYGHPTIIEKIKNEYPLLDTNSVARLSFWPSENINVYAGRGDTSVLPYGIYYARKNWVEVEWATSHPNDMSPWIDTNLGLAGNFAYTTATYIKNITAFSGEYYPKYTLGTGGEVASTQVAVKAGQNILVNSQTNPSQNGVYRVTAGAWIKLSQPAYPSIVYVWGYYASTNYLSNYTVFSYVRSLDSSNSLIKFFLQTSTTTFASNYLAWQYVNNYGSAGYMIQGTWGDIVYPLFGFYLYHTLDDALNNTNKITYTPEQSNEYVITDPSVFSIDENHIQHTNVHTDYYFSPIDYTYPSFALQKGIGCCHVPENIVSSDIPDNMSFTYMGQSVSLKRFSTYYPEVVTEAEAVAYNTTHYRVYSLPPLRWYYYQSGTVWFKQDMFKNAQAYTGGTNNENGIMVITPATALFSGAGINLKTPINLTTLPNLGEQTIIRKTDTVYQTGFSPYVFHDVGGRMAYFWAVDLNTIAVAILYTNFSYYYVAGDQGYNIVWTDDIVFSGGAYNFYINESSPFYRAAWAVYTNANPNSSSREATFNIGPSNVLGSTVGWTGDIDDVWHFQRDFLATLPTSITVNRGGEFTLPEQLRLNMPNCFFANQYTDIDTTSLVKGTTKIVQDPISVGSVNVVLTLNKTDGIYYSEVMTLGPIKGAFKIKTDAYQLNTGNWVADHSIQSGANAVTSTFGNPNITRPFGDIKQWNLGGYSTQFNTIYSGFWYNNTDSFKILGGIKLTPTTYQYFTTYDFNYGPEITPKWYVANDALGGYPTGLSQGTVWMDTRVPLNKNTAAGAHLGEGNSGWCAVMFSEWQDLRQPATNSGMSNNTIGPPMIINSYGVLPQNGYSNNTAESYTLGGPLYRPDTDFYKRNHYYVQSNDANCWLSSLSV